MSESAPEGTVPAGQNPEGTTTPPAAPNPAQSPGSTSGETDYKAEAERLRAELRKFRNLEDKFKAVKGKADRFDEVQQSLMTESERAQAAIEQANTRANESDQKLAETQRELALYRAGVQHGLEKDDLELLEGVPVDKIEERAKALAAKLKRSGIPNFDGGSRTPPPANQDMNTFIAGEIRKKRGY